MTALSLCWPRRRRWRPPRPPQSGNVTATFTFSGLYPNFTGLHLTIAQGSTVFYDEPVASKLCGSYCAPGSPSDKTSSVHVLDLEHDGQPDVVLDLYSGGAHCCSIEQIFSFDPGTMTYAMTQHDFGDPGEEIVDLGHNGRYEFLTADDCVRVRVHRLRRVGPADPDPDVLAPALLQRDPPLPEADRHATPPGG